MNFRNNRKTISDIKDFVVENDVLTKYTATVEISLSPRRQSLLIQPVSLITML